MRALVSALIAGLLAASTASALPMYAQRSGRTCANCHVSPTLEDEAGWDNPSLLERKCTMSCVGCHVDPTGGGLRNASGRYYGQSTLGILHTQPRSYSDHGRELLSADALWRFQQRYGRRPADGGGRTVPSSFEEVQDGVGAGQRGLSLGDVGEQREMDLWDGRYGSLTADPVLQLGADLRAAWWSEGESVFPMQLDGHAAVQPVDHLTASATLSGRATTSELSPVFLRRAFLMVHELPGMSFARGGVFLPSFGHYADDHTRFTRRWFELDPSTGADQVVGAELGLAPNYPYATASVFADDTAGGGWGAAVTGGWRDLAWSVGGSAMLKERPGDSDLRVVGLHWGLSPLTWTDAVPLTLLGEAVVGERSGVPALAVSHELWWLLRNGVNARFLGEQGTPDGSGWQQRYGAGLDVTPLPGWTLSGMGRVLVAPGVTGSDVLLHTHLWF